MGAASDADAAVAAEGTAANFCRCEGVRDNSFLINFAAKKIQNEVSVSMKKTHLFQQQQPRFNSWRQQRAVFK